MNGAHIELTRLVHPSDFQEMSSSSSNMNACHSPTKYNSAPSQLNYHENANGTCLSWHAYMTSPMYSMGTERKTTTQNKNGNGERQETTCYVFLTLCKRTSVACAWRAGSSATEERIWENPFKRNDKTRRNKWRIMHETVSHSFRLRRRLRRRRNFTNAIFV